MSIDTNQDLGASEAQSPASVKRSRAGTRGHKPDGTPWLHPMTFRASAQDRDRIEKRAAKAGLPVSTYVRQSALKTRIVNAKGPLSLSAADLALVQAISAVGITLAKELPRVGKPHALPDNLAAATTQLSQVLDDARTMIRSRDLGEAERLRLIGSFGQIANNLNQQTRALNTIVKRKLDKGRLPTRDIAVTLDKIAALLPAITAILGDSEQT